MAHHKKKNGRAKPRPIPEVLTDEERAQVLAALQSSSILERRNAAMVRLMLNLGLRSAEVVGLTGRQINFKTGKMKVRGKGGRERVLWISQEDLGFLQQFDSDGAMFKTEAGRPLSTRFLRYLVADLGRRAGIGRHLHPHLLRHTFASDLLRTTNNLVMVQKALGHSSIQTTAIYTHIHDPELERALKNLRSGD